MQALPGFCLPHFAEMLQTAEKKLNKSRLEEFLGIVIPLQQKALAEIDGDLDWFVQKFDYRNADAPWKNSKDAVQRGMGILKGYDEQVQQ